ncbi:PQQ-dependent sugar dehydrogenase [Aeromicrobium stalagmiti]|uniref:PQQ-dependent sugar dehydrogenase n=1 Tax=Aeromicrobium stalagmiti TaxID=2738988 RepID=UPI0015690823|nr:PQQ-dependent sugar dehydrogenase [Aeromicrobium stalagmiti]NRQ51427.1 PQQ-dependent sugar dehydrogenase [Aeromicrobium stalagmiti]
MRARAATPSSLLLGALALVVAGCGVERGQPSSGSPAKQSFAIEEVDRFDDPWAMAFLPDGDLLVTERSGRLNLRDAGSAETVEVDGVPSVEAAGQGGLGDVVLSPTFEDDGLVYLSWVEADDERSGAVVGRARLVTGERPALADLDVIWRQTPKVSGDGHFGHRLAFDPDGEHLFVSSGERQQKTPAQDPSSDLGKVVRMGLDGSSPETWTSGHRNPLGLDFAPDGTLWSTEMGPEGGDELNVIEQGANYGWPEASNGSDYGGGEIPDHAAGDGFVAPEAFWTPSISPGSLLVYDGDLFPGWKGDALIGALSGEALVHVDLDGAEAGESEIFEMGERIRAVEQGPDGAVWLLEDAGSGRLLKLTPKA